jgi:hypothetical protein
MLASFSEALASKPDKVINERFDAVFTHDCGDFKLEFVDDIKLTLFTYKDKDGNTIRTHLKMFYKGTATKVLPDGERGLSIKEHAALNFKREPGGPETSMGVKAHYTVPGEGVIVLQVGRLIWDDETLEVFFESGKNRSRNTEALLCEAFKDL